MNLASRCFFAAALAFSGAAHAQPPTGVRLPSPARGEAAIAALGAHLPEVAKAYGLRGQELVTLLRTQPSMGVDLDGSLLFVCEGLKVTGAANGQGHGKHAILDGETAEGTLAASTTVSPSMQDVSTTDAFKLHSLPGASRLIYLDFNGHSTSGTSWNSSFSGGSTIVSAPFDLDGSPSTFNSTEQNMIRQIWKRVAEDYAPFAINVTTEDPGIEALRRTSTSDAVYGVRVVITPSNFYSSGAGGVAYVGSFNWSSDTPAFVFSAQLANGEKYIAEACSHEAGHTLGLHHDGASGTEYYAGHGDWAPIMGNSYYKNVTQFSRGEYSGANNTQDDIAVIQTYAPLTSDDHGNSLSTATALTGPTVADGGTIETRTDVDVFRLDAQAGTLSLSFTGGSPASNLNIKAELLNSAGQVLQSSDPTGLNASLSASLAAGTYYVRVSGAGYGDPLTTGYSTYGTVGNYVITGSYPAGVARQAPVARISTSATSGTAPLTVSFSGQTSSDADGTISSYQWSFGTGASATGATTSYSFTTPGTYVVILTVTDNDGLTGSASVSINVASATNSAPIAKASANVTSGPAPLAVTFSSTGSYDPDGSIASYFWNFGDGTTSTSASPTKSYSTAGTYTAVLTVTDNAGAKASASLSITATSTTVTKVDLHQHTLTTTSNRGGTTGEASLVIRDSAGKAAAGVTVTLQWSGVVSGTSSAVTDSTGRATFASSRFKKSGTLTSSVVSIVAPAGMTYDGALFSEPLVRSATVSSSGPSKGSTGN